MGKDSRLPHEVDLTGVVEPGVPFELALTVVRWSDATYLEDQDHWHHAGIHRSVFAYATPKVHIADIHATADYDIDTGEGRLRTVVRVGTEGYERSRWTIRVGLDGTETAGPVWFEHPTDTMANFVMFAGRQAVIEHTVARQSEIGDGARVGPFANLQPGCRIGAGEVTGAFYTGLPE